MCMHVCICHVNVNQAFLLLHCFTLYFSTLDLLHFTTRYLLLLGTWNLEDYDWKVVGFYYPFFTRNYCHGYNLQTVTRSHVEQFRAFAPATSAYSTPPMLELSHGAWSCCCRSVTGVPGLTCVVCCHRAGTNDLHVFVRGTR